MARCVAAKEHLGETSTTHFKARALGPEALEMDVYGAQHLRPWCRGVVAYSLRPAVEPQVRELESQEHVEEASRTPSNIK